MSYRIEVTSTFRRQAKSLRRRYKSLGGDLERLISKLEVDPALGIPIGHSCYKIRLSISSKGRGKSSGGRVITHVHVSGQTVYLLAIYDKSERTTISDSELAELLKDLR